MNVDENKKKWQKLDTNVDEQNEPEYLKKSEI